MFSDLEKAVAEAYNIPKSDGNGAKRGSTTMATTALRSLQANLGTVVGILRRAQSHHGSLFLSSDELFSGAGSCFREAPGSVDRALMCTALSGGLPIRQALVKEDGVDIERCCISGISGAQVMLGG